MFVVYEFYPAGGMDDCVYKTNNFDEAKRKLAELKEEGLYGDERYIYDISKDEKIEQSLY